MGKLTGVFLNDKILVKPFGLLVLLRLKPLLALHLQPINVVVYNEPYYLMVEISYLGIGFALICFQRLSGPNIATQPCS